MATTSYKPTGYVLGSQDDSAKAKLKAIALPLFKEFKASGKIDATTIAEYAQLNNLNQQALVNYILELTNEQTDDTANKIKAELFALAESITQDVNEKLAELKDVIQNNEAEQTTTSTTDTKKPKLINDTDNLENIQGLVDKSLGSL